VSHHEPGSEVLADGETPEDGLGHDAQGERERDQQQITPKRAASGGQDDRDHREDPHES
jgi:hypothetical protein